MNANATTPTPILHLLPVDVSVDGDTAYVDGVECPMRICYEAGDASVGCEGFCYPELGTPKLSSRPEWDAAHPGVEPTPENMAALIALADDRIGDAVADYAADNPPEPDFDCVDDDDYGYWGEGD